MLLDKKTMPAKRIFGNIFPNITLTKKGQVRFNTVSRDALKIKDHVYFRLFISVCLLTTSLFF